jgi:hypothetical protein
MKRKVISSTSPNEQGELLWRIHAMSSQYCDGEDTIPVDAFFFVLAKSKDEAEKKVQPNISKALGKYGEAEKKIETSIVTLENLIVARDSSGDGRLGCYSVVKLSPVSLTCEEDKKRYKLQVCLVPIE